MIFSIHRGKQINVGVWVYGYLSQDGDGVYQINTGYADAPAYCGVLTETVGEIQTTSEAKQ